MSEYLLEILCEEIPANALPPAREQLKKGFAEALAEAGYARVEVRTLSTVRRLIVSVTGLTPMQPDRDEEVQGPPVRAAYAADGAPTQAAIGFAKALGVSVDALRVAKGPKGEVIAGTRHVAGRVTTEVLAEITRAVVTGLHFPKTMRWGAGEVVFVRPVHRIVALLGDGALDTCVPVELFGVRAGSRTVGHRVSSPGEIELAGVGGFLGYAAKLAAAGVIVDPVERLARLEQEAKALSSEVGCAVRPDPALVAEHVELVEFPGVVRGEIEARFLELPEEILVTTLRHHQKCLVLEREGKVAPYFLAVADRGDDPQGLIRQGNEWVSGARLADAAFFFAQDRKQPLAARSGELSRVVFHKGWGAYDVKVAKMTATVADLAAECGVEAAAAQRACALAKIDLTTAMVGEFPELQGVVGGIYARMDGEPDEVAQAVYDQYTPVGLEGRLPRGTAGALLGVADRLDTIAAIFAAGEVPSGSKDPFGLRRAALGVVRICAEAPLPVDLGRAAGRAAERWKDGSAAPVVDFVRERVRFYLTSVAGASTETAEAVLTARWGVVPDDVARARALEAVRHEDVFAQLAVAFKRVRNILAKSGAGRADESRLGEPAERALLGELDAVEQQASEGVAAGDVESALRALGRLAAPLDGFFTDVLVLCEDEKVREARLALLKRVEDLFLRLADLSKLSV